MRPITDNGLLQQTKKRRQRTALINPAPGGRSIPRSNRALSGGLDMPSVPIVIEQSGREERVYDIYSRLLKDRIVFLQGQVDDDSAGVLVAQLVFLHCEDPNADIHLYINSPG